MVEGGAPLAMVSSYRIVRGILGPDSGCSFGVVTGSAGAGVDVVGGWGGGVGK